MYRERGDTSFTNKRFLAHLEQHPEQFVEAIGQLLRLDRVPSQSYGACKIQIIDQNHCDIILLTKNEQDECKQIMPVNPRRNQKSERITYIARVKTLDDLMIIAQIIPDRLSVYKDDNSYILMSNKNDFLTICEFCTTSGYMTRENAKIAINSWTRVCALQDLRKLATT